MATLILPDGTDRAIDPHSGRSFALTELYRHLACDTVELVRLKDGRSMFIDEDAKGKAPLPAPNARATTLLHEAGGLPWDVVLGPALVCTPDEAGEEEEDA
jgi:hypothetical protein